MARHGNFFPAVVFFLLLTDISIAAQTDWLAGPVATEAELLALSRFAGRPACSRNCSRSEKDAHHSIAAKLLDIAVKTRREVNWRVYYLADGTYAHSFPMVSDAGATFSRMAPIATSGYSSSGHIHWDDMSDFSALDWTWVARNKRDLYLASRDGSLRILTPSIVRRTSGGKIVLRNPLILHGHKIGKLHIPEVPQSSPSP